LCLVSDDLHTAFKSFLSTPSERALLASISSERIVPGSTVPGTSDFYADLSTLAPHLKPNEALYILLRAPSGLTTVAYVPDAAPVRQKTLFASTRLTLTRELGSEHFVSTSIFCTDAKELSAEGWRTHEAHENADAPLTEEERGLVDIREAEASEVGGTGRRGAGYGGGAGGRKMDSGEGVVEALKGISEGGLVVLGIDVQEHIVLVSQETGVGAGAVADKLDKTEPRYAFYGFANSHVEGGWATVFIYTCPTATKVRDRMIYASSRRSVEALASSEAGLTLAKKIEASDPEEISAAALEAEFAPKQEQKIGFAKPKRPGRR
jgi:twinfilin